MDQDEFETALAAQVADKPEEVEETPEEEEPEAEAVAEEPEEAEEAEEETEEEAVYPEAVQAYIDKYGGDPTKALEAAVHAQETIGRQGSELGELRRMVEEIRDREPQRQPERAALGISEADIEAIQENPQQAVQWAQENNRPDIYAHALREWHEQDSYAATQFQMGELYRAVGPVVSEQLEPELKLVREQQKQRAAADAHRNLSQKYPDFQNVLETATEADLAGIDRDLLNSLQENNPAAAFEYVYRWVHGGRQQQAEQQAERTEKVRKAKREAAVVSADQSNTQPEKTTMDKLKDAMLSPEPQSVYHGLTNE